MGRDIKLILRKMQLNVFDFWGVGSKVERAPYWVRIENTFRDNFYYHDVNGANCPDPASDEESYEDYEDPESEEVPRHRIWKPMEVEGDKIWVMPFELLDQVDHQYQGECSFCKRNKTYRFETMLSSEPIEGMCSCFKFRIEGGDCFSRLLGRDCEGLLRGDWIQEQCQLRGYSHVGFVPYEDGYLDEIDYEDLGYCSVPLDAFTDYVYHFKVKPQDVGQTIRKLIVYSMESERIFKSLENPLCPCQRTVP